jgi:hypothetical protein
MASRRQKEAREAEVEAEAARVAADKEREVARLRAQQERISDRQAQIDELRAKRYQEAKDRKWREEQLVRACVSSRLVSFRLVGPHVACLHVLMCCAVLQAAAAKKEQVKAEIARVREQQHLEKEQRLAEVARAEKEEYLAMINNTTGITDEEVWRLENQKKKRAEHRAALLVPDPPFVL